ncbi:multidrug resistance protein B [Steroidobacter denitrificans]|uniref:Multidrug resistance protein B n=2 Tax=Steroidobacter denitrificans TaxID=465721 RepID=A0A127FC32_STEDE|nr:DHA2 family efflux MFS transporter permease subunit [Steroidobacter denitrificans]AMN47943.1 multidrug resistance protein B [Steroidobacter denitrificans]
MNGSGAQAPLQGGALTLTAFALALGTFMQVLDSTIANVSLPTIAGNLGVSASQGTWMVTSFAVANGVAVPLTGWLMGRFGVVRVFVASVSLFTFASLLCGLAWSLPSLIVFRILQGAVSGPMIPGSQTLLIAIFPAHRRSTALGIWSMTTLIGPVAGPIFGGYICDNYHWSWIFFVNVPVGIFCALACWRGLRTRETPTRKLPIDTIGVALLVVWVGALQVVLDKGKDADWFHSPFITVLAILAGVLFIAWLIWELTDEHPAVDLRLFLNRNFFFGTVAFCSGYAVFFANLLLMPLWMQTQLDYTATWAGLVAAPAGVVAFLLTPLVARAGNRIDARIMATIAFMAFALSFFMRADFTTGDDLWTYTLPLLVQGIAMSCFFVSLLTIQLEGIPAAQIPMATGISNFARIISGSFAASLITTMWDRREAMHQTRLTDHLTVLTPDYHAVVESLQHFGVSAEQAAGMITREMVRQAYQLAANELFWLSGWIVLVMTALVWLTRRSRAGSA